MHFNSGSSHQLSRIRRLKKVVVYGSEVAKMSPRPDHLETIEIAGAQITFGIIRTDEPQFIRNAPENQRRVLVRSKAFSCNYRDLSIIFSRARGIQGNSFHALGSDFFGEVVETGTDVTELKIGDRVINNNHYDGHDFFIYRGEILRAGVCTNHASQEYHVLHVAKLMKIPAEVPDAVAAAFSIGAQTSYGMIRRLGVSAGSNILVTSARSNTSLFVINALKKSGAQIYAATTSKWCRDRLKSLGVKEVFCPDWGNEGFSPQSEILSTARRLGGFDYVVDPFFDVHLAGAVHLMAPGGVYITCGLLN